MQIHSAKRDVHLHVPIHLLTTATLASHSCTHTAFISLWSTRSMRIPEATSGTIDSAVANPWIRHNGKCSRRVLPDHRAPRPRRVQRSQCTRSTARKARGAARTPTLAGAAANTSSGPYVAAYLATRQQPLIDQTASLARLCTHASGDRRGVRRSMTAKSTHRCSVLDTCRDGGSDALAARALSNRAEPGAP